MRVGGYTGVTQEVRVGVWGWECEGGSVRVRVHGSERARGEGGSVGVGVWGWECEGGSVRVRVHGSERARGEGGSVRVGV